MAFVPKAAHLEIGKPDRSRGQCTKVPSGDRAHAGQCAHPNRTARCAAGPRRLRGYSLGAATGTAGLTANVRDGQTRPRSRLGWLPDRAITSGRCRRTTTFWPVGRVPCDQKRAATRRSLGLQFQHHPLQKAPAATWQTGQSGRRQLDGRTRGLPHGAGGIGRLAIPCTMIWRVTLPRGVVELWGRGHMGAINVKRDGQQSAAALQKPRSVCGHSRCGDAQLGEEPK